MDKDEDDELDVNVMNLLFGCSSGCDMLVAVVGVIVLPFVESSPLEEVVVDDDDDDDSFLSI